MKDAYSILIEPHITEKTMKMSYGDPNAVDSDIQRKYTFRVAKDANKIEIKRAIEEIYNSGKKKEDDLIEVDSVRTITIKGKMKRNFKKHGKKADFKKAIITLKDGQLLDDFGV